MRVKFILESKVPACLLYQINLIVTHPLTFFKVKNFMNDLAFKMKFDGGNYKTYTNFNQSCSYLFPLIIICLCVYLLWPISLSCCPLSICFSLSPCLCFYLVSSLLILLSDSHSYAPTYFSLVTSLMCITYFHLITEIF